MKTRLSLFFAILATVAVSLAPAPAASQYWEYGPDTGFQFFRFDGIYFPDTGLVYFLGGRLADDTTDGSVWSFDPETGTYTDTGVDLPLPVSNYTLNILQDSTGKGIYLVSGRLGNSSYTHAVQVYYPATNTAVQRPGADDWPTPPRIPGGVVEHGNKLYVFGGTRASDSWDFAQTWVFDPSLASGSRWSQLVGVNLTQSRGFIYACVVDGYAYAIGGEHYSALDTLAATTRTERLNLSNTAALWDNASVADLSTDDGTGEGRAFGFDSGAGHPLAGHIVIAGGGQWPSEWANCSDYSVAANTWSTFPSLVEARRDFASAFVPSADGGTMWVFGGRRWTDSNVLTTSERYVIAPPVPQGLDVTVNHTTLAAGDTFTVDVAVQPLTATFDAWGCIFGPGASAYSFTLGNPTSLRSGTDPLVQDIPGLPAVYTTRLLEMTIPPGVGGEYTVVVELVPANLDPLIPIEGYADEVDVTVH